MTYKRIVLIVADQFRSELMSCRNHPLIKTPHLDALASESVLFKNFYTVTAPCGPSRMSLFTGHYACSHNSIQNMTPLESAEDNLANYLTKAGMQSYFIGYNDYAYDQRILSDDHPKKGFNSYDNVLPGFETILYHEYDSEAYFENLRQKGYPESLLNHDAIHQPNIPETGTDGHIERSFPAHYKAEDSECCFLSEQALTFFNEHKDDESWFLSLNYIKPHPPHICSDPYHRMYNPDKMPQASRRPEELEPQHPYLKHMQPNAFVDEQEQREINAIYYGMISELDDSLGVLFNGMKEMGLWEDTLIIFTSDHGEYMGDHFFNGKGHFYNQSMHIPGIVHDPHAKQYYGQQVDAFAESVDICPSILDYAGVPIPKHIQGQSLKPYLQSNDDSDWDKTEIHHEFSYSSDPDNMKLNTLWVIRDKHWKYVHFADPTMKPMLYDLQNDPDEFHDLGESPEHRDILLAYSQKMLSWRMQNENRRMQEQKYETAQP